jgi:hypothetical protein
MEGFLKSMPQENSLYIQMLEQTQAFSEFIHDREAKKASDPSIKLFDEIILSKKNRGKTGFFSRSSMFCYLVCKLCKLLIAISTEPAYLQDTSEHLWRTSNAPSTSRTTGDQRVPSNRIPAKLDPVLIQKPRAKQGAPIINSNPKRKPLGEAPALTINFE